MDFFREPLKVLNHFCFTSKVALQLLKAREVPSVVQGRPQRAQELPRLTHEPPRSMFGMAKIGTPSRREASFHKNAFCQFGASQDHPLEVQPLLKADLGRPKKGRMQPGGSPRLGRERPWWPKSSQSGPGAAQERLKKPWRSQFARILRCFSLLKA